MTPRVRWFAACLAVSLASPIAGAAAAAFAIKRREEGPARPAAEGPFHPQRVIAPLLCPD